METWHPMKRDLYFALQIISGRMTYEMFLNESYELFGFSKPSCELELKAMAEKIAYKYIMGEL